MQKYCRESGKTTLKMVVNTIKCPFGIQQYCAVAGNCGCKSLPTINIEMIGKSSLGRIEGLLKQHVTFFFW